MSADRWNICPKCGDGAAFDEGERTLREDYEIGIFDGQFYISYLGVCECGFFFSYKHEEKVKI